MAKSKITNDAIRGGLRIAGARAGVHAQKTFQQLLSNSTSISQVKSRAREFLPRQILADSDDVDVLFSDFYNAEREAAGLGVRNAEVGKISEKTYTKVNVLTNFNEDLTIEEFLLILQESEFIKKLALEAESLMFDKWKSALDETKKADSDIMETKLYLEARACTFCRMVAAGSSGRSRKTFEGYFNSFEGKPAGIHNNCRCVWRPMFSGLKVPEDISTDVQVSEFLENYREFATTSSAIGEDSFITEINRGRREALAS